MTEEATSICNAEKNWLFSASFLFRASYPKMPINWVKGVLKKVVFFVR